MENFNIQDWQAKFLKEDKEVKEITSGGLQRIDGMIHRGLLKNS